MLAHFDPVIIEVEAVKCRLEYAELRLGVLRSRARRVRRRGLTSF